MDEVATVKERLDVAEVIGAYVPLKPAGRNLKAPCPFHQEKTASFMVSPEKQIWHCFGCHQGGDVFKFVMAMEGVDFRTALEQLARRAGVELQGRGRNPETAKLKDRLLRAHDWAVKYFQASLMQNPAALQYVTQTRRFNKATIRAFQIGYSPDDWQALTDFLTKKGFTATELVSAGLVGRKGERMYDLFRGRIMLPICDASGRPVGFTGRVLEATSDEPETSGESNVSGQLSNVAAGPKYLNTPQTPLYDKSRVIYGWHLAKEAIRTTDEAVLVEGNMDVVASHQAGVAQVVAASGTAVTIEQLKTLARLSKNIKLAFDQDAAGLSATERAIELAQQLKLNLSIVVLDGAKDPDELITQDPARWTQAIAAAPYVIDYLFERLGAEYDLGTVLGKRQFGDRLSRNLQRLTDPVERDHYIKRLSVALGVSEAAAGEKVEAAEPEPVASRTPAAGRLAPAQIIHPDALTALEEAVLALNLVYPEARASLSELTVELFQHEDRRAIVEALRQAGDAPSEQIVTALPYLADYVKILALRGEEEFDSLAPADRSLEAFGLSRRLQSVSNHQLKREVSRQLRQAEEAGDTELARELLAQYQTLMGEDE